MQIKKFENLFGVYPQKDVVTTGLVSRTLDSSYNDCMSKKEQYKRLAENKVSSFDPTAIGIAQQEEISCWEKHNEAYSLAEQFEFIDKK